MKINELSKLSGVSIRTLHYYDFVGLLKPEYITESGYRIYGESQLHRLETILMYKQLNFSLKEIREIIDNPDFDVSLAMKDHIKILKAEKKRIEKLIEKSEKMMRGENGDFSAFDSTKMENYKREVKEKWGSTAAYKEYEEKTKGKDMSNAGDLLMEKFKEFGNLRGLSPSDEKVQKTVFELKQFITENYYTCTNEILSGLGEMYVNDERFAQSIDKAGGKGTAQFVRDAIAEYVKG